MYVVGSIGTFFSTPSIVVFESLNVTGCSWVAPCTSVDVAASAVGDAGSTTGVYFPVAVTSTVAPSLSVALAVTFTSTPWAVPVNVGSGVNVTTPVDGSIV